MPCRPTRRLLAAACLLAAPGPLAAQTAAEAELCERVQNATRWPDARARVQAAAGGSGASGHFARGCLAMADEKWGDAAKAFERAVKENAGVSRYHYWLGRAYAEQAQRANVLKQASLARKIKAEFDRAVQLDPEDLEARVALMEYYLQAPGVMGGSVDKAREQANEVRRRNPYRGALLAAQIAARQKDWGAAGREYQQVIAQSPDSLAPFFALATLQIQQRQWGEAFQTADRLLAAHPATLVPQYLVGRIAAESGQQLDRGEQALRRYLGGHTPKPDDPPLANAHWRLGAILERRGQKDAARAEYQSALRLDPKLGGAKEALGRVK